MACIYDTLTALFLGVMIHNNFALGCQSGRYGELCDLPCSSHCKLSADSKLCNEVNGACVLGCATGWFGSKCEGSCLQQCKTINCDQNKGNCLDTAYGIRDSFSDVGPAIGAALTVGIPIMGSVLVLVYRYHKLRVPISQAFTYKKQETDTNVPIVKVTFPEYGMEHHIFQEQIYEALFQRDQDETHMYSLLSPGLGNSDEIRTESVHDDIVQKTQPASLNKIRSPSAKPTNRNTLYTEAVTRFLTADDNDYVHLQDETTYL